MKIGIWYSLCLENNKHWVLWVDGVETRYNSIVVNVPMRTEYNTINEFRYTLVG